MCSPGKEERVACLLPSDRSHSSPTPSNYKRLGPDCGISFRSGLTWMARQLCNTSLLLLAIASGRPAELPTGKN